MKNSILYVTLLAVIFISCQDERDNSSLVNKKTLSLQVEIDQMGSGLQTDTRTVIIDPLADEEIVNNLYLLFFKKGDDGISTSYTGYYKKDTQVELNTKFLIEYSNANTGNYSILAFANVEGYYINSPDFSAPLSNYLGSLTENMSIEDVMKNTYLYVDKNDDSPAILPGNLIMSGRTEKLDGEHLINLKLTRGVSRFDVQILDNDYELASISIWNNPSKTPLWVSAGTSSDKAEINSARFYGTRDLAAGIKDYIGGLYTFENYQSDPSVGDDATTCLILGIRKPGDAPQYYRININPEESGQSLKRNYVYQVTIRNVLGSGMDSEENAYSSPIDPSLNIDINNWNLDDEGLILTDGKNTLAVPSKIIRFEKEGGKREYTIFTQGEGTLTMSPNLPGGFTASLTGNQLTVNASDLGDLTRREGTLDLSFAGLNGTVQIIQQPKELHFLKVDKSIISGFPAARSTEFEGILSIMSSKDWEAKIYNTGGSSFSFAKDDNTALTTSGVSGDKLKMYITQDNVDNKVITGFVLISLKDEPGYNRVVMLKQSGSSGISIDLGTLTAIQFKANGTPKTIANAVPGDRYEFMVDPGTDVDGSYFNWGAQLDGSNSDQFELEIEKTSNVNRVIIYPKGYTSSGAANAQYPYRNFTKNLLDDVKLQVYWGDNLAAVQSDPTRYKEVPILQDALVLSVSDVVLSKKGEEREISINVSEGFPWDAEIISTEDFSTTAKYANVDHRGYILKGATPLSDIGNKLEAQNTKTIKVGFDKILFPLVNVQPKMKLKVSLTQDSEVSENLVVAQERLVPKAVNIANIDGRPAYGMIGNVYLAGYTNYINDATFFGKSSTYCYADINISVNLNPTSLEISEDITYTHAGSSKGRTGTYKWSSATYNILNNWKANNKESLIVYVQDCYTGLESNDFFSNIPFNGNPYTEATTMKDDCQLDNNGSYIIKYLTEDGPFGSVTKTAINSIGVINSVHSAISKTSFENAGGVAIMTEETYSDNLLIGINPKENIIFIGECELLNGTTFTSSTGKNINDTDDKGSQRRFLANFISYVVRAAQYGSHFTDHFIKDATTYPFDKLRTTNPEPYY